LKFGTVHPELDRYDFGDFDQILSFAESNEMCVRGHTLVWHRDLPAWLTERHWSREELIGILRDHIHAVVGRYRGRVQYWDVVNEGLGNPSGLRRTFWLRNLGPEYIEMAFRFAHEADSQARLFYNDYGVEGLGRKSDELYELLSELVQRGVPIHGVGLQAHVNVAIPVAEDLKANLSRLDRLGLEIHLTEVDVGVPQPVTQDRLWKQAILYQRLMDACLGVRSCTAFATWGFTDAHSWVPDHYGSLGEALPFDAEFRPKLSYKAIAESLKAASAYRTSSLARTCGRTDARELAGPGHIAPREQLSRGVQ